MVLNSNLLLHAGDAVDLTNLEEGWVGTPAGALVREQMRKGV